MPSKKENKGKAPKRKATAKEVKKENKKEKRRITLKDRFANLRGNLPERVWDSIFEIAEKKKLSEEKIKKLIEEAKREYAKVIVEPCEAVGIIAAQSLGEPGTQLTLRTKHYAGALEVSVGSGIQRVEEIVDGRSKTKYASMTIYLNEKIRHNKKKAEEFARDLVDVRTEDVAKVKEDFLKKTAEIEIIDEKVAERNLDKEVLLSRIRGAVKKGKVMKRAHKLIIHFPKDYSLLKLRSEVLKIMRKRLQGISGIEKTIVVEEKGEYIIKTLGTNLKAVLKRKEIDPYRTTTNDVMEISKVLGIEAGRRAVVDELHKTLSENRIRVDLRHLLLLADLLTFTGEIRGTVRTGIMRLKQSPFARAAFEETVKHLFDSALYGEREPLQGVVENLIVGLPVKVGTGRVELVMKE